MTDLDLRAGQIHRGLGVVARWPDIALVIPSDTSHDTVVDRMFHDLGPGPEAAQIVNAVNGLLAKGLLRAVALVIEATGGPMAMVYGPVEILVDGESVLNGSNGGVRQQLAASALRLTLRATELAEAAEPVAPYDLRRGVAPGGGLTLITVGAAGPVKLDPDTPAPPMPPSHPGTGPGARPEANSAPVTALPAPEPTKQPDPEPQREQPAASAKPAPAPGGDAATLATLPPPSESAGASDAAESGSATGLDLGSLDPPAGVRSGRFSESDPETKGAPAERAAPALEPSPLQVPFRSVVLTDSGAPDDLTPLPLASDGPRPPRPRDLEVGRVQVQGILCTRQHFNNPSAAHCMVCGLSMLHLTDNLVTGMRPTLGFIVFDDGSTFGLDRSYVIGREPRPTDGSPAQMLVLRDNNETLSRTHAALRLDDWTVQLVDLGSTNGTYVWDHAAERWNQLSAGSPVPLRSGDTVALGRRTLVFESVSRN